MGPVITLTTDFGLTESYAAAVKGAILSINSQAVIVDITHQVPPQNIRQAAFVLSTVYKDFPSQTIHLVIVDPGVGTNRRAIILKTPRYFFVAPDNGVLSYIIRQSHTDFEAKSGWQAVAITNSKYWRSPVSSIFHGRDIFAPVAAHLSLGVPVKEFGEVISSLTVLPFAEPHIAPNGSLIGQVIHIDSFGNLITNIKETDLPAGEIIIRIGSQIITGLSRAYAEGEKLVALIGSSGYLEIALREGNAAVHLRSGIGTEVIVRTETNP